ncbi:DNA cytosine methyltransferase [Sulfurovum sp. XTW-4]|uniref:DNA cytosine methyltransferase n=1 Tax=Sulfurovum xiamenensis TaxID=3019066 RepID=A0ABT7QUE9_9BACT|nr:DNA cytosine methyltransferase [Sulfurovum xiamenensis]MDM5264698.1 DNA cytosine methyltransferase [Sulfurovum xiamenensis]
MKILNLYAGIGGNRKLWGDEHEITAVEYNEDIAKVYKDLYQNDNVVVCDAHQYLIDHYKEFDFIWASPPCPTHSDIRRCGVHSGQYEALYPDMTLYQQIILLQNFAPKDTKFVIENVKPYYDYLIKPQVILHRHPFWSNFNIPMIDIEDDRKHESINGSGSVYGVSLDKYDISNKRQILRNMVNPEVGKYILDVAMDTVKYKQGGLFDFIGETA